MQIIKRIGIAVLTLLLVTGLTFVLVHNMPGDVFEVIAYRIAQQQSITYEEALQQARAIIHYDPNVPLMTQFTEYAGGLLRGDLGMSVIFQQPVNKIVAKAVPWTVFVLSISLLISFLIGTLAGMVMAWKRKTFLDPIVTTISSVTDAIPDYVTALLLMVIFAVNLRWFPTKGAYSSSTTPGFNLPFIISVMKHGALPIFVYILQGFGGWALLMKGSAVSVLGEDYIMAARARGLKERRIITNYLGRNALLPSVTALAMSLGGMLGGSVLVETVYAYPGLGWFFGQAVSMRDYGLMQGLFFLTATAVITANLLADLIYSRLDPRIRTGE